VALSKPLSPIRKSIADFIRIFCAFSILGIMTRIGNALFFLRLEQKIW